MIFFFLRFLVTVPFHFICSVSSFFFLCDRWLSKCNGHVQRLVAFFHVSVPSAVALSARVARFLLYVVPVLQVLRLRPARRLRQPKVRFNSFSPWATEKWGQRFFPYSYSIRGVKKNKNRFPLGINRTAAVAVEAMDISVSCCRHPVVVYVCRQVFVGRAGAGG